MLRKKIKKISEFDVKKLSINGRLVLLGLPYVWLLLFFLFPCLILLKVSFTSSITQIPPYTSILSWLTDGIAQFTIDLNNYVALFVDEIYLKSFITSILIAIGAATTCLLIGYPMAYAMVRSGPSVRLILLMLVVLPFWTSFLIRVYAWVILLTPTGLINKLLLYFNFIDQPLKLAGNYYAVTICIVYTYLPFMVLPLYSSLEKIDFSLIEAAYDLGSVPTKAFFSIILPLSMRGVVTGFFLVFMPAIGEYVIPEILGDPSTITIGRVVWNEFFINLSWPRASALAVIMMLFVILPVSLWYHRRQIRTQKPKQIISL